MGSILQSLGKQVAFGLQNKPCRLGTAGGFSGPDGRALRLGQFKRGAGPFGPRPHPIPRDTRQGDRCGKDPRHHAGTVSGIFAHFA